jgi:decaprenylphospho-beta-D-ribofuranose 2-oxidase
LPRRTKTVPFNLPGFALNHLTMKALNGLFYRTQIDETRIVGYEEFFYPLDSVHHWNRLYGKRGFIQYQALFPPETSRQALKLMLEAISEEGSASFLAVLKSTGEQGEGLLSYPKRGHTLALDFPNHRGLTDLTAKLDRILLEHGGRLYLAKDRVMTRETFEKMYPNLPQFMDIRRRLDPNGKLASDQARRLGLA